MDVNYAHARALNTAKGKDYIPLAPNFTLASGINYESTSGLYGGMQIRHIKDRSANEDNSIIANGYTVADASFGCKWKNITLGIQMQNLFDVAWNETQFATESRLQNEINSVEEIHFTPGTQFALRGTISIRF